MRARPSTQKRTRNVEQAARRRRHGARLRGVHAVSITGRQLLHNRAAMSSAGMGSDVQNALLAARTRLLEKTAMNVAKTHPWQRTRS